MLHLSIPSYRTNMKCYLIYPPRGVPAIRLVKHPPQQYHRDIHYHRLYLSISVDRNARTRVTRQIYVCLSCPSSQSSLRGFRIP